MNIYVSMNTNFNFNRNSQKYVLVCDYSNIIYILNEYNEYIEYYFHFL